MAINVSGLCSRCSHAIVECDDWWKTRPAYFICRKSVEKPGCRTLCTDFERGMPTLRNVWRELMRDGD